MSGRLGGMNARDIRVLLRGKVDPDLGKTLVALAERQDHLFQLLGQLAQSMDVLADALMAQGNAVSGMQRMHDDIKLAKRAGVKVASEVARDGNDDD